MSDVVLDSLEDLHRPVFGIDKNIVLWLGFTFNELFLQILGFVTTTIMVVLNVDFKLNIPWETCFIPMYIADIITFVAAWVLYRKQNTDMSYFENKHGKSIYRYPEWYRSAIGYETNSFKILSWVNFCWKTFAILCLMTIKLTLISMLSIISEPETLGDPTRTNNKSLVIAKSKSRLVVVGIIAVVLTTTLTCTDMQDWNPKSPSSTQRRSTNNSN